MNNTYLEKNHYFYISSFFSYLTDSTFSTDLLGTQTYGNGDSIQFEYDEFDQITAVKFKDVLSSTYLTKYSYAYDTLGRLSTYREHENGAVVNTEFYAYDGSGRIVRISRNDGTVIDYAYDLEGNLCELNFTFNGVQTSTHYNYLFGTGLFNNTNYISLNARAVELNYHYQEDALKRLNDVELLIDEESVYTKSFAFEGDTARIRNISYNFTNVAGIDYRFSYVYDELGNIVEVQGFEGASLTAKEYYEYDEMNQLVLEDVYIAGEISYTKIYHYDNRGNRISADTYSYESRETGAVIPAPSIINDGYIDVIPIYNGVSYYGGLCPVEIGETDPIQDFMYEDSLTGEPYYADTVCLSNNLDSLRKGYYVATYRATATGIDVTFNIRFKVGNLSTVAGVPNATSSHEYDLAWPDQLTAYETTKNNITVSHEMTYDSQGNPLTISNFQYEDTLYDHAELSWDGRELHQIIVKDANDSIIVTITYTYNDQGYRTSQTIQEGLSSNIIEYTLLGDKILYETNGSYGILYTYDQDGTIIGFNLDANVNDSTPGLDYFYVRNQQNDVIAIVNALGLEVVRYHYDAYGVLIDHSYAIGYENVFSLNPYTYRGYRYDQEISMYYLNSRYYHPEIGRFLNADGMLGEAGDILSTNMYAYCVNNPIMNVDPSGFLSAGLFRRIISSVVVGVSSFVVGFVIGGPVVAVAAAIISIEVVSEAITDHYKRNELNVDLPENKQEAVKEGWDDSVAANCHQFSAENGPNVKFVSPEGLREVIFDSSGNLVTDPRDIGTYNFSPSGTFFGSIGHMVVDVIPWVFWGNSEDDNTTMLQRIGAFLGIH